MIKTGDINLHNMDVLDWVPKYKARIEQGEARPLSAIFNDAPYGLSDPPPMDKVLSAWLAGEDFYGKPGFMGKAWDNLPPAPHIWRALLKICHPGAWCFTFTSSRTQHLLGVSLALAGWEVRDSIVWLRGSGLALGANIGKAIDREAGAEREVVGPHVRPDGRIPAKEQKHSLQASLYKMGISDTSNRFETAPATPLAQQFDGYHTNLKGLHEVIVMAQAPRQGHTFAALASKFGTGGLNVEASRVKLAHDENVEKLNARSGGKRGISSVYVGGDNDGDLPPGCDLSKGRFPPNAAFSHTPPTPCPTCHTSGALSTKSLGLQGDGVPDEVECLTCKGAGWVGGCKRVGVRRVKASVGIRGASTRIYGGGKGFTKATGEQVGYADPDGNETVDDFECVEGCAVRMLAEQSGERPTGKPTSGHAETTDAVYGKYAKRSLTGGGDTGTAARFFPNFTHDLNILEPPEISPFFYCAKASRGERDAGIKTLHDKNTILGDGLNSATKIRTEEQAQSGVDRGKCHNPHPCVKPITLCKYLAKMLKPPDEFDPVLAIPFSGSGSEVIGAILAGWQNIEAIEREPEYHAISEARVKWWLEWQHNTQSSDPATIRKLATKAPQPNANGEVQLTMFSDIEEATK